MSASPHTVSGWLWPVRRTVSRLRLKAALYVTEKKMGKGQQTRRTQFALLLPAPDSIVFLGDSITEGGLWEEWFPGEHSVNRGIGGETSVQVLERIDGTINDPAAVFLLIGTNDLTLGYSIPVIAKNVERVVARVRALAPHAQVIVQSVMPRGARWKHSVLRLNAALADVADRCAARYIDLWPALSDSDGALRPGMTIDGLHLTGPGYKAWVHELQPFIAAIRAEGTERNGQAV